MKINIQKIAYRVIPVLTVFAVLISCIATPALAVDNYNIVDYNDYITQVDIVEDRDIVTVHFPEDMTGIDYSIYGPNGKTSGSVTGGLCEVTLYKGVGYEAYVHYEVPFFADGYLLDFRNIPNGSIFSASLKVGFVFSTEVRTGYFGGPFLAQIEYYDADFNYVGTDYGTDILCQGDETRFFNYSTYIDVDKPDGAVYGYVSFPCNGWTVTGAYGYYPVIFDFSGVSLSMNISSLYRLRQETGRTNKLLEELINGTPEQNDAVNDAVGEMNNAAGELDNIGNQLAGVDKPDMDSVNVSVDSLVPYSAMLAYVAPIQVLWENPTLLGMLSIVLVLVIVSWVFFGKKGS